jgi:hypothetical protein
MTLHKEKYKVIRNVLSKDKVKIYEDYLNTKEKACSALLKNKMINPFCKDYGWYNDTQILGAYCLYGDSLFDNLMVDLKPRMEKETGLKLTEMYTYSRIYRRGMELERHKDRGQCAISTTLNLGGDPWSIYIDTNPENGVCEEEGKYKAGGGKGEEVLLEPGDMMIYLGCECEHWREPFFENYCPQLFIHYMETKNLKTYEGYDDTFDTRICLGMPAYSKRIHNCSNTGMYKDK